MATKPKFQISRLLDEKIKRCLDGVTCGIDCSQLTSAYILGFKCGSVTNYVGLTTDHTSYHSSLRALGIVFFKKNPSLDDIKASLETVQANSSNKQFLIYTNREDDTTQVLKRIFDYSTEDFLSDQPKLSVLEENKIFAHSALTKLKTSIKLDIRSNDKRLLSGEEITKKFKQAKDSFLETKRINIHLKDSNFSTNVADASEKILTESLYDHLDVPNEVAGMGDYLPQLSKAEKGKLAEKWRNKVKASRAPIEVVLEHEDLTCDEQEKLPANLYLLNLEVYLHLHMANTLAETVDSILNLVQNCLNLTQIQCVNQAESIVEEDELKICTFFSSSLGHLIYCCYVIPKQKNPNYQQLHQIRQHVHSTFLVPVDQPQFRYSQQITSLNLSSSDEEAGYLCNVHSSVAESSGIKGGLRTIIRGKYTYHHYMQDRISDSGWGCAYRSLQTIISWFKHQGYIYSPDVESRVKEDDKKDGEMATLRKKLNQESRVPTHEEIQKVLVDLGDKQASFIGSQKWIGSQEVCYVLNHLYNLESKFISVSSGSELVYKVRDLGQHFSQQSTPVMIGGGVLAHTIIGTDFNEKNGDVSYLILDPHYTGSEDVATITKKGWCGWKKNNFWEKNAFYNLCLPQRPNEI